MRPGSTWMTRAYMLAVAVLVMGVFGVSGQAMPSPGLVPGKTATSMPSVGAVLDAMLTRDNHLRRLAVRVETKIRFPQRPEGVDGSTIIEDLLWDGDRSDLSDTTWSTQKGQQKVFVRRRIIRSDFGEPIGPRCLSYSQHFPDRTPRFFIHLSPMHHAKEALQASGGLLFGVLEGDYVPAALILKQSGRARLESATEKVDGVSCYVVEGDTSNGHYTLWVDPLARYCIRGARVHKDKGDLYYGKPLPYSSGERWAETVDLRVELRGVRLAEFDGVVIPVEEVIGKTEMLADGTTLESRDVVTRSNIRLDPDFDVLNAFVVREVPDGTSVISRDPNDLNYGYEIRDGRPKLVGGGGCPVVGRVTVPAQTDTPKTASRPAASVLRQYSAHLTRESAGDHSSATQEGQHKRGRRFRIRINDDGSFRVENVPAGAHFLVVELKQSDGTYPLRKIGGLVREFTVPADCDAPIDLETMELEMASPG